jgi:hypothetical protein
MMLKLLGLRSQYCHTSLALVKAVTERGNPASCLGHDILELC